MVAYCSKQSALASTWLQPCHPRCPPLQCSLTQHSRVGRRAGRTGSASACQTSTACRAPATAGRSAAPWAALRGRRREGAGLQFMRDNLAGSCTKPPKLRPPPAQPTLHPQPPQPTSPSPRLTQHFVAGVQHGGVVHQVPHVRSSAAVRVAIPAGEEGRMGCEGHRQAGFRATELGNHTIGEALPSDGLPATTATPRLSLPPFLPPSHLADPGAVALVRAVCIARQLPGLPGEAVHVAMSEAYRLGVLA